MIAMLAVRLHKKPMLRMVTSLICRANMRMRLSGTGQIRAAQNNGQTGGRDAKDF
jgi:hypothetical protein